MSKVTSETSAAAAVAATAANSKLLSQTNHTPKAAPSVQASGKQSIAVCLHLLVNRTHYFSFSSLYPFTKQKVPIDVDQFWWQLRDHLTTVLPSVIGSRH